ncbi:ABC transporter permease [Balneola vulgaris]|uniref:ABC transporter permease n=1 Tax=Balneola vulgaris TaxID=287535 RepID=UPI001F09DA6A|nr:FtsX-like permease family protein [Balneola vulgaris]
MSITGVAVGSAGLLIALSIGHGFKSTINNKIYGFAPHYTIATQSFITPTIERSDTLLTYLDQLSEIDRKQAVVQGQVMIQTKDDISGTILKGVNSEGGVSSLPEYISEGTFDLGPQENGLFGAIIGVQLAQLLKAEVGDVITTYTINGIPSLLNSPEIKQFTVTAIYQTGIDLFDDVYVIVDRREAQSLFQFSEHEANAIELKLADNEQIEPFQQTLINHLPFPFFTESIFEKFGNIFAWVELQEQMTPLIISVMIIVAAFNLIGTVLMMILERTKDIGILKTLGTPSSTIRKIFLLEGLMVSFIGLVIGIGITLIFAFLQTEFQLIPLSEENYYMQYVPIQLHAIDFFLVTLVTLFLCGLASWVPARVAAQTDPLKVISFGR